MQSLLTELSLSCCALNEGDQDGDGGRSLENLYVQLTIQPIPGVQPPTRVRTFPASEVQGFNHISQTIHVGNICIHSNVGLRSQHWNVGSWRLH